MIEEIAVSPFVARRVQRRIGSVHLQPFSYREVEGLHCLVSQAKTLELLSLKPLTWPCEFLGPRQAPREDS
jgi:hypothetical protein